MTLVNGQRARRVPRCLLRGGQGRTVREVDTVRETSRVLLAMVFVSSLLMAFLDLIGVIP